MPLPRAAVITVAAILQLAAASTLTAQSAQKWSVQASGLFVGTFGTAYDGLKAGPGFEAQLRYTPSLWSIGFGAQASSHDFDDPELQGMSVTLAGAFVEPRRVIDIGSSSAAPYLSVRVAFLQQSIDFDVDDTSLSASASGAQLNAGGGVLIRMSPRINLDLGATYGLIKFSDVEVDIPGEGSVTVQGSSGNGSNLVLRVGLAFGLK
ncbi:MAG: hypothetical protein MNPFHGCM_01342 [Gemmatimonadaceae bacterium]|nr:hypothetical protein [Gemmatimonadaceae bacterium]